jgi:hypothetical protein
MGRARRPLQAPAAFARRRLRRPSRCVQVRTQKGPFCYPTQTVTHERARWPGFGVNRLDVNGWLASCRSILMSGEHLLRVASTALAVSVQCANLPMTTSGNARSFKIFILTPGNTRAIIAPAQQHTQSPAEHFAEKDTWRQCRRTTDRVPIDRVQCRAEHRVYSVYVVCAKVGYGFIDITTLVPRPAKAVCSSPWQAPALVPS